MFVAMGAVAAAVAVAVAVLSQYLWPEPWAASQDGRDGPDGQNVHNLPPRKESRT